jgi:DNA (cytosine-5)-methyltransferase 1
MRNGVCWEQTTLVPRIDGSGCGFWPTATAQVRECDEEQWEARREQQGGTLRSTYLQDAVKYQVDERSWPTPKGSPSGPDFARTNREGSGGDDLATRVARGISTRQTWGTPTSPDHKDTGANTNHQRNADKSLLGAQVMTRAWATPRSEDSQCAGRRHNRETSDTLYAQTVTDANQTPGSLNPTWVEWLMGWPRGWTDCEHLVTDRYLKRWRQRSCIWLERLGYFND